MMCTATDNTENRSSLLCILRTSCGQSTIEYLVVTFVLVAALITMPSIYDTVSDTMINKYQSYSFGIAVSDPPRKELDDKVTEDINMIRHILDVINEVKDVIEEGVKAIWDEIKKILGL